MAMSDDIKRIKETVRQGTNPHLYWCTAKKDENDEGRPCLMIKQSALDLGVKVDVDKETEELVINGPPEIMVSLMQDVYESKDGKPFELRFVRSAIASISHGEDYVAFIMDDSDDAAADAAQKGEGK